MAGTPVDLKNDIIPPGAEIEVTVRGKGNYIGSSKSAVFRVVKYDITKVNFKIKEQTYTGKPIELDKEQITAIMGKGKNAVTLEKTDYEIIDYSKNTNQGTATVTLRGLGNYGGTKRVKFVIKAKMF